MIQIKPVSDLRNKFAEIEKIVNAGNPVFLTKNGYGAMVVLSLEEYSRLTENIDNALVEAELEAQNESTRYSREEMYDMVKGRINAAR